MSPTNRSILRALACGLYALVAATAIEPAHAGAFRATWDPPYGAPFTNLGWEGSIDFEVPLSPPCNTSGATCIGSGSNKAYLKSGYVRFYDTANSSSTLAEINWNLADLASTDITGLVFVTGNPEPTQLSTDRFPGRKPVQIGSFDDSPFGNFLDSYFALKMVIDFPADCNGTACFSGPLLYNSPNNEIYLPNDYKGNPVQNFRIAFVPEPASLALVAGALLAVGTAARRKRTDDASRR